LNGRTFLGLLRRQLLLVLLAVVAAGAVAYKVEERKPNVYQSSASLLLFQNSNQTSGTFSAGAGDIGRFSAVQSELVRSAPVVDRATEIVGDELTSFSVRSGVTADILTITAQGSDPKLVQATPDALIDAYITYRSTAETEQLRRSADLLKIQSDDAFAKIAEIDTQIAQKQAELLANAPLGIDGAPTQVINTDPEVLVMLGRRPSLQDRYETLFRSYQDVSLTIELSGKPAERLSSATLPTEPISPNSRRSLFYGLFGGLVLGLGVAGLREQLDTRIRSGRDVEALLGLPVLGEIPTDRRLRKSGLAHQDDDAGGAALEAIRSLRTSIEIIAMDQPIRRLMITSAVAGEGKTTVTAALGSAFARLGRRVVIVSADLRRPQIEALLEISSVFPGVSDYVLSPASAGQDASNPRFGHLRATVEENLFVVPAGSLASNPTELLASAGFERLLNDLSTDFDLILIDTPPILLVADSAIVARLVDGVLAVVSIADARRDSVERLSVALTAQPARVLGVALNKSRTVDSYGYGGGYSSRAVAGQGRSQ
jgi:capsular exopolysaccharide synthesis family protein